MSADENPYAPPATRESAAPENAGWRVDGYGVHARHGTVLPQVDLETGHTEGKLLTQPLVLRKVGALDVLPTLVIVFGYVLIRERYGYGPELTLPFIVAVLLLARLAKVFGGGSNHVTVWHFAEAGRVRRARVRRGVRIGVTILIGLVLFVSVIAGSAGGNPDFFFDVWLRVALPVGVLGLAGMIIWGMIDRPRLRVASSEPGWLRVGPVDPGAMVVLGEEQARLAVEAGATGERPPTRVVHLHRFPFRLLAGRCRNPLILLRLFLLKLRRSKLLRRECYHHSAAAERTLETLSPKLRAAADGWLDGHPDWHVTHAENLPSPAGDLTVESVVLASGDFAHCLSITWAWMVQMPKRGDLLHTFHSWLADGTLVRTHDRPFLELGLAGVTERRARGAPARVFAGHLAFLGGRGIDPPAGDGVLRARLMEFKDRVDECLTAAGYQNAEAIPTAS